MSFLAGIDKLINPETGTIYTIGRFLGSGISGQVYYATSDGEHYAIKVVPMMDDYVRYGYNTELNIYRTISRYPDCNPYIVCLHDAFELSGSIGVSVLELMEGSLQSFEDAEVSDFILDILLAIVTLHRLKIVHGDLQPRNIFRSYAHRFKLGDFSEGSMNASPSYIQYEDEQLAITLLRIIYKINKNEDIRAVLRAGLVYPRRESYIPSYAIKTMLDGMLQEDEKKRWSSEQALEYIMEVMNHQNII